MTFEEALKKVKNEFPDRQFVGYWYDDGDYIFQSKVVPGEITMAQFVVEKNGRVYGTNPLYHSVIDLKTMRRVEVKP